MRPSLSLSLLALLLATPSLIVAVSNEGPRSSNATAGSEPMAGKSSSKDKSKTADVVKAEPAKTPTAAPVLAPAGAPGPTGMTGDLADYDVFAKAVTAAKADAERSAQLFVQALTAYTQNYDLGIQMLSLLLRPEDLKVEEGSLSGFHPMTSVRDDLQQLNKKPDIVRGYCGGTPGKKYEDADLVRCPVVFDRQYSATRQGIGYPSDGRAKFFLKNGGAASPRPVELEFYENDRWLVRNFGGLLTGVARYEE